MCRMLFLVRFSTEYCVAWWHGCFRKYPSLCARFLGSLLHVHRIMTLTCTGMIVVQLSTAHEVRSAPTRPETHPWILGWCTCTVVGTSKATTATLCLPNSGCLQGMSSHVSRGNERHELLPNVFTAYRCTRSCCLGARRAARAHRKHGFPLPFFPMLSLVFLGAV